MPDAPRDPSPAQSYASHRERLFAATFQQVSTFVLAVTAICAAVETSRLPLTSPEVLAFLPLFGVVGVAMLLARGPMRQRVELVALMTDLAFTAGIAGRLFIESTTMSGAALFLCLKMLGTAVFFPWSARCQYVSSILSVAVFYGAIEASGRSLDAGSPLHHLIGPVVAALMAAYGAASSDRTRRMLYDQGVALAESEQQLRALLGAAPDGILVLQRGRIVFTNPAALHMLGHGSAERLHEGAVLDLVPLESRAAVEEYLRQVSTAEGSARQLDAQFIRADATTLDVGLAAVPFVFRGQPSVQLMVRDITARKQTEAADRRESEFSAALARVGQEMVASLQTPVLLDRLIRLTTELLDANATCAFMRETEDESFALVAACGPDPEVWESLRVLTLPRELMGPLLDRVGAHGVVQAGPAESQAWLPRPLPERLGVQQALFMPLQRGTELIGVLAVYRGTPEVFTEQQERIARAVAQHASLALAHAELVRELEGANQLKSEFVATMSHELRTPLNIVLGYTSLLLEDAFGPLTREQTDTMRRIDKSAKELLELIDATLNMSRLEAGRVSVDCSSVGVGDMLSAVAAETRELLHKPGVEAEWQVPDDLPAVYTDALKLKLVLKNLVGNAAKFTERGRIRVSARPCDGGVEFAVADTGRGIAPHELPVIFEPFRQVERSETRRYGGVGLGLYIVRRLVEMLRGTVSVESELGTGSTFRVWVPADFTEAPVQAPAMH
jgi:PAS domain S-box-containing protein